MDNKISILLVDQDLKGLESLKTFLVSSAYDVETTDNGNVALKMIEKNRPDMVISEVDLLDRNGWELCKSIKQRPDLSDILFFFLTSNIEISDEVTSFECGADDFIKKPFIKKILHARIKGRFEKMKQTKTLLDGDESGIWGSLKNMNLTDIIQMMHMNNKTVTVHLSKGEKKGSVFIKNGKVVHVHYGSLIGEDAFFHMLAWNEGTFSIEMGAPTDLQSISKPMHHILLEGFKKIDDRKRKGNLMGSVSMENGEESTIKKLVDLGIIKKRRLQKK